MHLAAQCGGALAHAAQPKSLRGRCVVGTGDPATVVDDAERDPALGVPERDDHVPRAAVTRRIRDRFARDPRHVLPL